MKKSLKFFFAISTLISIFSKQIFASAAVVPKPTFLPVEKIYSIEHGFDTTDTVEIAVKGFMPNSCYTLNKGVAHVDEINMKIYVSIEGYVRENQVCWMAKTPYLEVIQIGHLKQGHYTIQSIKNPGVTGKLHVSKSVSNRTDDHLYAPVDTVEILPKTNNFNRTEKQQLILKGTYPHLLKGCMRIVKVKSYKTKNNVLVVLPIAQILNEKKCHHKQVNQYNRFKIVHKIKASLKKKGLVHVRTLNGRALNKLVDFTHKLKSHNN